MTREMRMLHEEVESLITLHRYGLFDTPGFKTRKHKLMRFIRENNLNVEDLDPLTLMMYRRYLDN